MHRIAEALVAAYAPLAQCRALVEGWPPPHLETPTPRKPRGKRSRMSIRFPRFTHVLKEARP